MSTQVSSYTPGAGVVHGVVELPTLEVPCTRYCSWVVARTDTQGNGVSRLKHANRMCPFYRQHQEAIAASLAGIAAVR